VYYFFYDKLADICRSKANMKQSDLFHSSALERVDVEDLGLYEVNHCRLYRLNDEHFGVIQSANPFDSITGRLILIDAKDILADAIPIAHIYLTIDESYYKCKERLFFKNIISIHSDKDETCYLANIFFFNIAEYFELYSDTMHFIRCGQYITN